MISGTKEPDASVIAALTQGPPRATLVFLGVCLTLGLGSFIALQALSPSVPAAGEVAVLLLLCALFSELVPVARSLYPVRRAFRLPFIAALASISGPAAAWLVDVATVGLGGFVRTPPHEWRLQSERIAAHTFGASVASGFAGFAWIALSRSVETSPVACAMSSVAYVLAYAFAHLLLHTYYGLSRGRKLAWEGAWSLARRGLPILFVYAWTAASLVLMFFEGWGTWTPLALMPVLALQNAIRAQSRMFEHYYGTIGALVMMLQRAHAYTHEHIERVARLAEDVALRLGLPLNRARLVREAAVLHDIGKIAIDEEVLDKPTTLSEEEFAHVRQHALFGAEILSPVKPFKAVVPWILHHHERPDGKGYPNRLSGDDIPIESRIIAVADAFDAMTDRGESGLRRPYRKPKTYAEAIAELERCAGTQFDERVVQAFVEAIWEGSEL